MDKLLVEIYVPAISSTYDVYIPRNACVSELLPLVTSAVEKLSNGLFIQSEPALCDGVTGNIFNNNMMPDDMKLKNGSRLMLI